MNKYRLFFLISMLWGALSLSAGIYNPDNIPVPRNGEHFQYISNPDAILTDSFCTVINDKLSGLERETGVRTLVIVVEHVEGDDIHQFCLNVGNKYGIGNKEDDRGLIIALATLDRTFQIETGQGLEAELPDAACYQIAQRSMVPLLKEEKWGEAMVATVSAVRERYSPKEQIREQSIYNQPEPIKEKKSGDEFHWSDIPFLLRILLDFIILKIVLYLPNFYYCEIVRYKNKRCDLPMLVRAFLYCFNWIWNLGFSLYYEKPDTRKKSEVPENKRYKGKLKKANKKTQEDDKEKNRVYYVDNRNSFFRAAGSRHIGYTGGSGGGYSSGGSSSSSGGGGSFGGGGYGGGF